MSEKKEKELDGGLTMHGRLVARKISPDGSDAIRVADDQRQSVTADLTSGGAARYEVAGKSSQNEEGTLYVCQILAHRLRDDRIVRGVQKATGPERGVDCEILTNTEILQVQITRPATPDFWKTLNTNAEAKRSISLTDAAADVVAVVKAKAQKTSFNDRAQIILALDATETAVHAMPSVVRVICEQYSNDIAKLGFKAVWIVGPTSELTFRIDQPL
ncbi:MAG: hypothetical protein QXT73_06875 [Candidatus Methanomethylicaceae archaeon]